MEFASFVLRGDVERHQAGVSFTLCVLYCCIASHVGQLLEERKTGLVFPLFLLFFVFPRRLLRCVKQTLERLVFFRWLPQIFHRS